MTGLNIDGDAAHDAAQRELTKPIYPRPSLTDRLTSWIDDLLYKAFASSDWLPGGWITLALFVILSIVAMIVIIRVARRTMRSTRDGHDAVLSDRTRSAAHHRRAAEAAAAQGDWTSAIRDRLRAVARELEESGALDPVPGRTATELAVTAGAARPELRIELSSAAETFNGVSYGDRPGSAEQYHQIVELDEHLRGASTR
ncbi:DUF4129 domain-containing protein [Arthrobacter sp. SLBN-53]|uniref:DUF4129 domain-containing protein n=1 Tax=Arthrobacter sp. SLBN-53 TaxID=2768412 RepID=UPI001152089F|nr:DUF4129 domain-containing protein [Arthrobacter sp. SLBN-53]TQK29252.1 uncharacterized protein DUF4129 [Arthrobacter sp. SLBN-53]